MSKYEKRIKELNLEVLQRNARLQNFNKQLEEEKQILQQKLGALQELSRLEKEEKPKEKLAKPPIKT